MLVVYILHVICLIKGLDIFECIQNYKLVQSSMIKLKHQCSGDQGDEGIAWQLIILYISRPIFIVFNFHLPFGMYRIMSCHTIPSSKDPLELTMMKVFTT